eukprot:8808912-Pyramimonas_sp.AAC.1
MPLSLRRFACMTAALTATQAAPISSRQPTFRSPFSIADQLEVAELLRDLSRSVDVGRALGCEGGR